jgi:hypothetical protein
MFSARGAGTVHEIEQGHVFFVGAFSGVFFNDVDNGFIDKIAVECPGVDDIVNGLSIANHGHCIMTDKDGDKVSGVWKGKDTSPNVGGGDFQWTGGMGKYTGRLRPISYSPAPHAGALRCTPSRSDRSAPAGHVGGALAAVWPRL